jgi:uncharacterized protein YdaU (DUF1376 family)
MGQRDNPDWFSFYPYEFIEDENVVAMTMEERGIYITLLCRQWVNGSIPADIPSLARMLNRTPAEMETLWAAIAPCFPPHPELADRVANARLERERNESLRRIAGASAGGRASAESKRKRKSTAVQPELNGGSTAVQPELNSGSTGVQRQSKSTPCNVVSCNNKERPAETDLTVEFRNIYPAHRLDDYGVQCFMSAANQPAIIERLRSAVKSDDWTREGGRFVPKASKWIMDGAPAPKVQPVKPSGGYFDPRKITG